MWPSDDEKSYSDYYVQQFWHNSIATDGQNYAACTALAHCEICWFRSFFRSKIQVMLRRARIECIMTTHTVRLCRVNGGSVIAVTACRAPAATTGVSGSLLIDVRPSVCPTIRLSSGPDWRRCLDCRLKSATVWRLVDREVVLPARSRHQCMAWQTGACTTDYTSAYQDTAVSWCRRTWLVCDRHIQRTRIVELVSWYATAIGIVGRPLVTVTKVAEMRPAQTTDLDVFVCFRNVMRNYT